MCHHQTSDGSINTTGQQHVLERFLQNTHPDAQAELLPDNGLRIRWPVPSSEPLVSLLIPTRDRLNLVEPCVRSSLDKTAYHNYEILILDNASDEPETLKFFEEIQKSDRRVRVLPWNFPFNYSAINNFGVAHAKGDVIGFLNNDIEVISPDWLSEMLGYAVRQQIGCVGAKLYYADMTIQHAGIVLGIGGVAGHPYQHMSHDFDGYFKSLKVVRNVSAVTGAALMIRREVFQSVGGFDEQNFPVALSDVDLGLKVLKAGYRNVWTPFAQMYHYESKSRGRDTTPEKQKRSQREIKAFKEKWGAILYFDPYYNENLCLMSKNYGLSLWSREELKNKREERD